MQLSIITAGLCHGHRGKKRGVIENERELY
jgi:hypothetical protein